VAIEVHSCERSSEESVAQTSADVCSIVATIFQKDNV